MNQNSCIARVRSRAAGPVVTSVLLCVALATAANAQDLLGLLTSPQAAGDDASQGVTRTDAGLLDVHVRDIEIVALLEMLSYQARVGIVSTASVKGQVSANLYSLSLQDALAAILRPNRFAFRQVGNTIFVGTEEEIEAQLPAPQPRLFRLKYISPNEAEKAVQAILSPAGKVSKSPEPSRVAGGEGNAEEGAGDANVDYLIVTDHEERLAAVEGLLSELDQPPRQVLIEATILRATLNEANELGIDFTLLSGMDFQGVFSTSNAAADVTTGPLPFREFEHTNANINTGFTQNVTPGGLRVGVISNNIGVFLSALEEVTDVAVVANPKLVALNKQQAEVIVGRRDGYLTTTVTQTAAVQTVQFLETGTQIRFTPFINDDNTVRLRVHPKDSSGGLTATNLPFEETTEARGDILVRDGHTVLIGGLFRERTSASQSQIPLLGDIPLGGVLFQSQSDRTTREEVIILLTVHVLKDTPRETAEFRTLLDDIERIRVGSRKGLMGIGREVLSQAFYQEAIKQAERNRTDLALFNVRAALHNHPNHNAALKLKEQLLGRTLWDGDGTRMRSFSLRLISPPADDALPPALLDDQFNRPIYDQYPERAPTRPRKEEDDAPPAGTPPRRDEPAKEDGQ